MGLDIIWTKDLYAYYTSESIIKRHIASKYEGGIDSKDSLLVNLRAQFHSNAKQVVYTRQSYLVLKPL
jgi:hypothetical protein